MNQKTSKGKRVLIAVFDTIVFTIIAIVRGTATYHDDSLTYKYGSQWYQVDTVYSSHTSPVIEEPIFIACLLVMIVYLIIAYIYSASNSFNPDTHFKIKIAGWVAALLAYLFFQEDSYVLGMLAIIVLGIGSIIASVWIEDDETNQGGVGEKNLNTTNSNIVDDTKTINTDNNAR